jgi:protein-tyrosine phosphatase
VISDPLFRVLFVCFGNICRSPLAEGILRAKLEAAGFAERVVVDSAGTSSYNEGRPPDWRARWIARRHGFSIGDLRARAVRADELASFDVVIAMDRMILRSVLELAGDEMTGGRVVRLVAEYGPVDEIDDPVSGTLADFERTYRYLDIVCDTLLDETKRRAVEISAIHE